jgi:small GTP-binding protein
LNLWNNQLRALPVEIAQLQSLTSLDLGRNQLSELPPEIGYLQNLTSLNLWNNQLRALPVEIAQLQSLTSLDLWSNQLRALPLEIAQLQNLTVLDLRQNHLSGLPPEISQLQSLTSLDLGQNQLSELPPEIGQLQNLTSLDLGQNQLSELPPEIGQLQNLTSLDLGQNQLSELPPEIGQLQNLTALNLSNNNLSYLPPEIAQLQDLTSLNLSNNALVEPPPEIVRRGIGAIFEYLRGLQRAEVNNEAKLILVGEGDVGKTCLAIRLTEDKFQEQKSTEGIDILDWKISAPTEDKEEISLNVWDFGGQEIYHSTHQFFLTKRSVYLLVWNARKSKDYDHIYYWLQMSEAFGGDSPVILVMTKMKERQDDLNMADLRERFPQIVASVKVENEDGAGILELKKLISETAWKLPHMRMRWNEAWLKVRKCLEDYDRSWIELDEFKRICAGAGLNEKQADILDEYLHDLGVIIHFRDNVRLRNTVILKPEWGTKAVYHVLDTDSVRLDGGILRHSKLGKIWDRKDYPAQLHPVLLELMNEFELAYELPDRKSHLVAELLPSSEPDDIDWDDTDNLRFYYSYDFLPAGVITRFIVLIHPFIEKSPKPGTRYWREGAVLQWENTRAFVRVRKLERLIEIRIQGQKKREMLAAIRMQFDHINSSIRKVEITQEIPCACEQMCTERFDYRDLVEAEWDNVKEVQCRKRWVSMSLSKLLDGYQKPEDRRKEEEEEERKKKRPHPRVLDKYEDVSRQPRWGDGGEPGLQVVPESKKKDPQTGEKKFYQDRTIQAALIGGFCLLSAALISSPQWWPVISNIFGIVAESGPEQARKELIELEIAYEESELLTRSKKGDKVAVKLFMAAGMSPDVKDENDCTLLMHASANGRKDVVECLLENNADPNAKDINDKTALMQAEKYGYEDIAKVLKEAGAKSDVAKKMEGDNNASTVHRPEGTPQPEAIKTLPPEKK